MRRSVILALVASLAAGGSAIHLASSASAAAACYPAWSAATVYVKDNNVSYQSKNYTAKWWTLGEVPTASGQWGVWADKGSCGGTTPPPSSPPPSLLRPARLRPRRRARHPPAPLRPSVGCPSTR